MRWNYLLEEIVQNIATFICCRCPVACNLLCYIPRGKTITRATFCQIITTHKNTQYPHATTPMRLFSWRLSCRTFFINCFLNFVIRGTKWQMKCIDHIPSLSLHIRYESKYNKIGKRSNRRLVWTQRLFNIKKAICNKTWVTERRVFIQQCMSCNRWDELYKGDYLVD